MSEHTQEMSNRQGAYWGGSRLILIWKLYRTVACGLIYSTRGNVARRKVARLEDLNAAVKLSCAAGVHNASQNKLRCTEAPGTCSVTFFFKESTFTDLVFWK